VDWKDTDRIANILADFHAQVSPDQFEEMQKKAREAYDTHLRLDSFSKDLAEELRAQIRPPYQEQKS
jgi:Fe-S-cluster formation regulator IscX/YfhJ